ncbi:PadR family transcriptional regulator [Streptomyces odontomachi]|uniref:PadR family transcriptional regulator n=1 Tax=Streptomyces odontomachi TaxID=2944940 RepID=UPI0021093AE1|nr:PadR family transcriptional regulator [Streptomyces sp. ODS25]
MPQNALDNPLVLPMLGLLAERPCHQYALLSQLRVRYPVLRPKTSTVYTLVGSLQRAGLVELADGERAEARLTEAGFTELKRRVAHDLSETDPNADPRFLIALAYLGALGPERATALVRDRAQRLRADRRALTRTLDRLDAPELHMIEAHFLAARLDHDAAWLRRLADRIDRGELGWPDRA